MTTLETARIGEKDTRKANRYGWKCIVDKQEKAAIETAPEEVVAEEIEEVKPKTKGKKNG